MAQSVREIPTFSRKLLPPSSVQAVESINVSKQTAASFLRTCIEAPVFRRTVASAFPGMWKGSPKLRIGGQAGTIRRQLLHSSSGCKQAIFIPA
jgi:hypothetical protein